MNNYELDKEKSKSFIKGYDKKYASMIVKYGDNHEESILLTTTNENIILSKMNEQVKYARQLKSAFLTTKNFSLVCSLAMVLLTGLIFKLALISGLTGNAIVFNSILIFTTVLGAVTFGANYVKSKNILKDIKKQEFFRENEKEINDGIVNNIKVINNVNTKAKKNIINKLDDGYYGININDINIMSLSELKKLKQNIVNEKAREVESHCHLVLGKNKRIK